jgi:hypothetical protein
MAKPKRPRDPMQLAKLVIDMAVGDVPNDSPKGPESQLTKVRRAAGIKGGKARAKALSPRKRTAIARKGGRASAARGGGG